MNESGLGSIPFKFQSIQKVNQITIPNIGENLNFSVLSESTGIQNELALTLMHVCL
jgi:hypothetical protein